MNIIKDGKIIKRMGITMFLLALCVKGNVEAATASVTIDETTFPDEAFRACVSELVDSDSNGILSVSELNETTNLEVYAQSIVSLKGIEYFTNLETLLCWGNDIEQLDLSENLSLLSVTCSFNPYLEEVICSSNILLESLDCSWCDSLTVIDVTKNTNLDYLQCTGCPITVLDVSKNLKLTHLECATTNITTLDVSKNTNLEVLNCSRTELPEIDISANTELLDLDCEEMIISELDVSKNTKLQVLRCSWNSNLTSLDLSNNTELVTLDCAAIGLIDLDLSANTKLETVAAFWQSASATIQVLDDGSGIRYLNFNDFVDDASKVTVTASEEYSYNEETGILVCADHSATETQICYTYSVAYGSNTASMDVTLQAVWSVSTPNTSSLSALSAGIGKVRLTWDEIEGVSSYLIYGYKDGVYGYVGMTHSGTTYTDTKALVSDYNYYWVFPYYENSTNTMVAGSCSSYVYAKGVCERVYNLKSTSTTSGNKLTWSASEGADGYLIYGIRPGESYGYIGMTTLGTTFTDTKASTTDYTFYWVFPYHLDEDGTMIPGAVPEYTYGRAL